MTVTVHVTVSPPPLADPLHWLTVKGKAVMAPSTVQVTVEPPPVPEPLHWVTIAPGVSPGGLHVRPLGPEGFPDPLHWLMVIGAVATSPVMMFVMVTVQVTVEPPALTDELHCEIDVTRSPS